tara:strand:- start:2012 stop:2344 length:333 start_codon:yes stop_codon:yes gene_type:complete
MDLSKKFIYVNPATDATQDEAKTYPASGVAAIYEVDATNVKVALQNNATDDSDVYNLTITSGEARTFMKEFVNEINYGKQAFIVLGDNNLNDSAFSSVDLGTDLTVSEAS